MLCHAMPCHAMLCYASPDNGFISSEAPPIGGTWTYQRLSAPSSFSSSGVRSSCNIVVCCLCKLLIVSLDLMNCFRSLLATSRAFRRGRRGSARRKHMNHLLKSDGTRTGKTNIAFDGRLRSSSDLPSHHRWAATHRRPPTGCARPVRIQRRWSDCSKTNPHPWEQQLLEFVLKFLSLRCCP